MKFKFGIVVALYMAVCSVSAAASPACSTSAGGKTFDGVPYAVQLSSENTHAEIMKTLGFDIRKAKFSETIGVDGVSNSYRFAKAVVMIGHNNETISVIFSRQNKEAVFWELCLPKSKPNLQLQRTPSGAAE